MATKRSTSPFDALKYEKPKGDPRVVAKAYVKEVSKIPEVLEVWAFIDGITLFLETLFEGDLQIHERIHGADLAARDSEPDVHVEFHARSESPDWPWLPENAVSLYSRKS